MANIQELGWRDGQRQSRCWVEMEEEASRSEDDLVVGDIKIEM